MRQNRICTAHWYSSVKTPGDWGDCEVGPFWSYLQEGQQIAVTLDLRAAKSHVTLGPLTAYFLFHTTEPMVQQEQLDGRHTQLDLGCVIVA